MVVSSDVIVQAARKETRASHQRSLRTHWRATAERASSIIKPSARRASTPVVVLPLILGAPAIISATPAECGHGNLRLPRHLFLERRWGQPQQGPRRLTDRCSESHDRQDLCVHDHGREQHRLRSALDALDACCDLRAAGTADGDIGDSRITQRDCRILGSSERRRLATVSGAPRSWLS